MTASTSWHWWSAVGRRTSGPSNGYLGFTQTLLKILVLLYLTHQKPRRYLQRCELNKLTDAARVNVSALQINVQESLREVIEVPHEQTGRVKEWGDGQKDERGRRPQSEADEASEQVARRAKDDEQDRVGGEEMSYFDHFLYILVSFFNWSVL